VTILIAMKDKCAKNGNHLWIAAMSTTTLRIEDELEARIAAAARRSGKSSHDFMRDAIEQTVAQSELDEAFHRDADESLAEFLATGKSVPWEEAKAWLEARAKGETPPHPIAR